MKDEEAVTDLSKVQKRLAGCALGESDGCPDGPRHPDAVKDKEDEKHTQGEQCEHEDVFPIK